jgi:hypothetical protein
LRDRSGDRVSGKCLSSVRVTAAPAQGCLSRPVAQGWQREEVLPRVAGEAPLQGGQPVDMRRLPGEPPAVIGGPPDEREAPAGLVPFGQKNCPVSSGPPGPHPRNSFQPNPGKPTLATHSSRY